MRHAVGRVVAGLVLMPAALAAQRGPARTRRDAHQDAYLYVWATAVDTAWSGAEPWRTTVRPFRRGVFLATVDLRPGSRTRGQVVGAVLAGDTTFGYAHHTEHALAADGLLFANDFFAGRTYRFDLRTPGAPRLLGAFTTAGPLGFPHSFDRLAGGTVLATYQGDAAGRPPGGLAELRRDGTAVRWARAATPGVDSTRLQPYSLAVLPAVDRVVTTSYGMLSRAGVHVQVWRLSDLALLHTLALPADAADVHAVHRVAGPSTDSAAAAGAAPDDAAPDADHHRLPAEPRVLADGRTVLLGTFTCAVYRLARLDGPAPRLARVYAFPGRDCAVPARVGRWWVQTVPARRALVTLDVADPAHPREVARVELGAAASPHWLAADASGRRLVATSGSPGDPRLHLVALDPATGALAPDPAGPTVDLSRVAVPGLGIVRGAPHGVVFGPGPP